MQNKKARGEERGSGLRRVRVKRNEGRTKTRRNPFRRFSDLDKVADLSDDLLYSSAWKYRSVNCLHSNGGLCCNCLIRRAEIAHHMMYSPLWIIGILRGLLLIEFGARITLTGRMMSGPSQLREAYELFAAERLKKIMYSRRGRLYNRETIWFHTIPVCKECHKPGVGVHSKRSWRQYPDARYLNHNYSWMRWKLRVGWIVTYLFTLPVRLWEYFLFKSQ